MYDRWKIFLNEKNKNKKYVFKENNLSIKSGNDFFFLSQNNNWNNYIFSKIQKFYNQNLSKSHLFNKKIPKKNSYKNPIFLSIIFKPICFKNFL